jgi:hypothetical protein
MLVIPRLGSEVKAKRVRPKTKVEHIALSKEYLDLMNKIEKYCITGDMRWVKIKNHAMAYRKEAQEHAGKRGSKYTAEHFANRAIWLREELYIYMLQVAQLRR